MMSREQDLGIRSIGCLVAGAAAGLLLALALLAALPQ